MYDFHKVKFDDHSTCFAHPQFRKGAKHLLSGIKRKVAHKESSSEDNSNCLGDLQGTIEKLQERLARLENRDRDREWLKVECQKLQQRNQQLEMFYGMCLNSLYSSRAVKERQLCIEYGGDEGSMSRRMRQNGLQKLWADAMSHYNAHNSSPKRLSEIGEIRRGSIGQMPSPKLAPCRRVKLESDFADSPRVSAFKSPVGRVDISPQPALSPIQDGFHSPGVSPGVSPLRLDVKAEPVVATLKDPIHQSPVLPALVPDVQGMEVKIVDTAKLVPDSKIEETNPAICNDLD